MLNGIQLKFIDNLSPRVRLPISITVVLAVGIFDFLAGPEISTALFYFVPIILISYQEQKRPGIAVSILCALVWLFSELLSGQSYPNKIIVIWNFTMRLVMFLVVGTLIQNLWARGFYFQRLANHDELTTALNRRGFLQRLQEELQRSKRFNRKFSLAFIDLDNFKRINDSFGHKVGDELLRQVTTTMLGNVRSIDYVGRMGGDEFAILYVETPSQIAKDAFTNCHTALLDKMAQNGWPVTFSVGVVTITRFNIGVLDIIELADKWMYRVKKSGKNCVVYKTDEDLLNDKMC